MTEIKLHYKREKMIPEHVAHVLTFAGEKFPMQAGADLFVYFSPDTGSVVFDASHNPKETQGCILRVDTDIRIDGSARIHSPLFNTSKSHLIGWGISRPFGRVSVTQQASETMRPTDDELEAQAIELMVEHRTICGMIDADPDAITTPAKKAAAMLRACKSPAPNARQEGWRAGIEAAAKVAQSADTPIFKDQWTSGQCAAAISAMQSIATAIRALTEDDLRE